MKLTLFSSSEKNMLVGALITSGVDTLFEGYYTYNSGKGIDVGASTTDPMRFFYTSFSRYVPSLDDLLSNIGVPMILYGVSRMKKNEKIHDMAVGAMVYGFADIIGWYAYHLTSIAATGSWSYRMVRK